MAIILINIIQGSKVLLCVLKTLHVKYDLIYTLKLVFDDKKEEASTFLRYSHFGGLG